MNVGYSPLAADDLVAIADYFAGAEHERSKLRFGERLICSTNFPAADTALTERPDVRVMPLTRYPYPNFYTVSGDELLMHTAGRPCSGRSR